MIVKLIRHNFPDRPDWIVINEAVPLGTRYEVIGYDSRFTIVNFISHEMKPVEVYLLKVDIAKNQLRGNESVGWLPTICFEVVPEES